MCLFFEYIPLISRFTTMISSQRKKQHLIYMNYDLLNLIHVAVIYADHSTLPYITKTFVIDKQLFFN